MVPRPLPSIFNLHTRSCRSVPLLQGTGAAPPGTGAPARFDRGASNKEAFRRGEGSHLPRIKGTAVSASIRHLVPWRGRRILRHTAEPPRRPLKIEYGVRELQPPRSFTPARIDGEIRVRLAARGPDGSLRVRGQRWRRDCGALCPGYEPAASGGVWGHAAAIPGSRDREAGPPRLIVDRHSAYITRPWDSAT